MTKYNWFFFLLVNSAWIWNSLPRWFFKRYVDFALLTFASVRLDEQSRQRRRTREEGNSAKATAVSMKSTSRSQMIHQNWVSWLYKWKENVLRSLKYIHACCTIRLQPKSHAPKQVIDKLPIWHRITCGRDWWCILATIRHLHAIVGI
jgi:hypothetical protein